MKYQIIQEARKLVGWGEICENWKCSSESKVDRENLESAREKKIELEVKREKKKCAFSHF